MAISWGSANSSNGAHSWAGIDYSVSAINQSTSVVTLTVQLYYKFEGWSNSWTGSNNVSYSGSWSGSGTFNPNASGNITVLVHSITRQVTLTDSSQSFTYGASILTGTGTASVSRTVSVGARFARTPTGVTIARISDSSHRIDWTRGSTYTAAVVQRSANGGSWVQVGRPTGNASTFTDTTTGANEKYEYRVAGVGGSGQSPWSAVAGPVFTTPAAPAGVAAERVSNTEILVSAAGVPPFATAFDVEDGGVVIASGVQLPWSHMNPSLSTAHEYRVRGVVGALKGDWSALSNIVQLLTPPLAPTELVPNGGVAASDTPVRFAWRHNPVDTTAQTAYELRHRIPAGAWTTLTGTTASFREVTLPVGVREWQVRTKGQHASFGDWSAIATVSVILRPGVAIQGTGLWDSPIFEAVWTWTQAQGRPQSAWQVELLEADVRVPGGFAEGSGAATSALLPARLVDGGEYTARVRAATGDVWSEWSPLEITVMFVPPADAVVSGGWVESRGSVELTVTEGGGVPVADLLTIERSVDGGVSWEPWIATPSNGVDSFSDHESLSKGLTQYRVTSTYTVNGAASTVVYDVHADSGSLWLSGGDGYTIPARLPFNPEVGAESSRERSMEWYDGRELPVAYAGEAVTNVYSASGWLHGGQEEVSAAWQDLQQLALVRSPVFMVRDPEGVRLYGVISPVSLPRKNGLGWRGYSFTLTETDH